MPNQYFLIKYTFKKGTEDDWKREIARFTSTIDADADLKGKFSYLCLKNRKGNDFYHLARVTDESIIDTLQKKEFFEHYTARTEEVAGGDVEVVPLEVFGETK